MMTVVIRAVTTSIQIEGVECCAVEISPHKSDKFKDTTRRYSAFVSSQNFLLTHLTAAGERKSYFYSGSSRTCELKLANGFRMQICTGATLDANLHVARRCFSSSRRYKSFKSTSFFIFLVSRRENLFCISNSPDMRGKVRKNQKYWPIESEFHK